MSATVETTTQVARVEGLPIAPYCSLRDGSVDALSVGKLSSAARSRAYYAGWLSGLNPTFLKGSGASSSTVFAVASLIVLQRHLKYFGFPPSARGSARSQLVACGTSSYTVGTLLKGSDPENMECEVPTGFTLNTYVSVDRTTRRPTPLDATAREAAVAAVAELGKTDTSDEAFPLTTMPRLPSSFQRGDGHFTFANRVRPFSDFDFNGHMNQGVYVNLALDAIYAFSVYAPTAETATASVEETKGGIDKSGAQWLREFLGAHVKSFNVDAVRVDYMREVNDPTALLHVDIWNARGTEIEQLPFVELVANKDPGTTVCPVYFEVSSATSSKPAAEEPAVKVINARGVLVVNGNVARGGLPEEEQ